jgi:hypothetical protein
VVNSLIKSDNLICQTGLSGFDSSNSATSFIKFQNRLFTPSPLGDIKGVSISVVETLLLVLESVALGEFDELFAI